MIVYDYNHTSREIDLNRREHFGKNTRLFMGDALGHWEGNTLVVDTANFNGHVAYSREIPYLRRFELTNPHAWLYIDVKELEGTVNQLAFRTWCAERSQQTRLADRHDQAGYGCRNYRVSGKSRRIGRKRPFHQIGRRTRALQRRIGPDCGSITPSHPKIPYVWHGILSFFVDFHGRAVAAELLKSPHERKGTF